MGWVAASRVMTAPTEDFGGFLRRKTVQMKYYSFSLVFDIRSVGHNNDNLAFRKKEGQISMAID